MATPTELLRFPAFADLPDDQIAWFLSQTQEVSLKAGEIYAKQGDPPDAMFVLLEGEFEWRGEFGGETTILTGKVGDVTGVLPFSRMKQFTVTGRALKESRILRFPAARFPDLIQKMPEFAKRLVGLMSDRIRELTRLEQQRDRLAGLGKLSAGLAHELNNPASAAKRASAQLRDTLNRIKDASHELGRRDLTPTQKAEIEKQLPVIESQTYRLLVLSQLVLMLSHQAICETEMIMCQRIVWIVVDNLAVALNRFGVVLHAQVVVRDRVTNLIVGRGAFAASRRETERLEDQHYQDAEARAVKD